MKAFLISGQLVDIPNRCIYPAEIKVDLGKIVSIRKIKRIGDMPYILPGFIDAHVHVESSMLVPSEFARLAVVHGTVATLSDPHEIANVCGLEGVEYMIENGRQVPFKFYFGAPSCVPATPFETAGGEITAADINKLLERKEIVYLAEMMNWPGTINKDPLVMEKLDLAKKYGKPVDGHAPGLKGEMAAKYASAGITTDHECFTKEEALDKIKLGMKIAIREGSAAKNFEVLIDLIDDYPEMIMFCSDDKHPDSLAIGHINELAARAIAKGKNLYDVLQAACINPILHYSLQVGRLRLGDPADFTMVQDLKDFKVQKTYIDGKLVAENGKTLIPRVENKVINNFQTSLKSELDFSLDPQGDKVRVIEALDGQLITPEIEGEVRVLEGKAVSNPEADILKITVVNRYADAPPAVAFIKNIGLKEGAIASSVGHDSHNIIAVGVDDSSICRAVNLLIEAKGGISAVRNGEEKILPLPVGGIMSTEDGYQIAAAYTAIDRMAKEMGSKLQSPFMTLSFMALLVIPDLKLSDKGLFDGQKFEFVDLFLDPKPSRTG
ncbi:adenine deaminase [Rhodonellum psychrophilum GCM71 = DSM 17998]|uniref:Adenine deaminase n=2 Tax=Rhodonellum TaxID=336827 RepID=U5BW85_9BACT|nr:MULTISPECIES: adenine deaminase [Rhodonellum]ERM84895.1 adenine deaminase [Rhodonellum psychrophilum GCM71 = DSM 17998]SDY73023.1 Adenine deaminase [Rhodonellum ikkaensis]